MNNIETPRVWVGCLACYNNGNLVGRWMEVDELEDELTPASVGCRNTSEDCPCEELWIFDHDGFCGLVKGEPSFDEAIRAVEALRSIETSLPHLPVEVVVEWLDDRGSDLDSLDELCDRAIYSGESVIDIAQEFAEQTDSIPDRLWSYIDWEHYAREMFAYDYSEYRYDGVTYLISDC